MSVSTHLAEAIYANLLGAGTTITKPTTLYLALFTTTVGADGSGTEATGGSYARLAVVFTDPGSDDIWLNNADLVFSLPAGTFTDGAVFDAVTGGNMLTTGTFSSPIVLASAGTSTVANGTLQFQIY